MGVRVSTAQMMQMDDEDLIKAVEEGYWLDRQRVERIIEQAKQRYLQGGGKSPPLRVSMPTLPNLPTLPTLLRDDKVGQDAETPIHVPRPLPLPLRGASIPAGHMGALWEFEGHKLKELQSGLASPKRQAPYDRSLSTRTLDEDGHPILYGCCGRDKKYARCAVCYFRKRRSNTAHYCACCQRPVCIRPRTYDGETHPMICWNVLHLDDKMRERVKTRKAQKEQELALVGELEADNLDDVADVVDME